jgi:hypothetical protein
VSWPSYTGFSTPSERALAEPKGRGQLTRTLSSRLVQNYYDTHADRYDGQWRPSSGACSERSECQKLIASSSNAARTRSAGSFFGGEFVVAAAQVLYECVAGGDRLQGAGAA